MRRNLLALAIISAPALAQTSDLSYEAYINSNKRIKCLYGYAAEKTGDHQAAIAIFEDCIARWSDIYSINPAIKYTKSCCVGDTWMPEIRTDSLRA